MSEALVGLQLQYLLIAQKVIELRLIVNSPVGAYHSSLRRGGVVHGDKGLRRLDALVESHLLTLQFVHGKDGEAGALPYEARKVTHLHQLCGRFEDLSIIWFRVSEMLTEI